MKKSILILTIVMPSMIWAQLQVFELFTDQAVLQRDIVVPIWGWDTADSEISVLFNKESFKTKTNEDGKWRVELPAMKAGGPYQIEISNGKEAITLKDIYFGDIWLCSGQSNMEWTIGQLKLDEDSLATFNNPLIRHAKVSRTYSGFPTEHLSVEDWQKMKPSTINNFTAVGSYFALSLKPQIEIPIGLLNSSWGGSRIEPWMSAEALNLENDNSDAIALKQTEMENAIFQITGESLSDKDYGIKGDKALWAQPGYDYSKWPQMLLPQLWERAGLNGLDGTVWFSREFELTEAEAKKGVTLSLGMIDDNDWTYVNGRLVGKTEAYNQLRTYQVPDSLLKTGRNNITIRVEDTGGGGGIYGPIKDMVLKTSANQYSLAGKWRYRLGKTSVGIAANQTPVILYNKMIHPMLDFPIKGVLWYQGESNANQDGAEAYRDLFKTMITDWRKLWKIGDFPFYWVSLANFRQPSDDANQKSSWAVLRESQTAALSLPNTAEALAIDVGEANDIHPKDKKTVGYRLGLAARNMVYGQKNVQFRNPTFKSAEVTGNRVILSFNDTAEGLFAKNKYKYVNGFAVADANGNYSWAKAKIVNEHQIEVTALETLKPTAIRYGWADNPDDLDLYNSAGLPVTPFRYKF